MPGFKPLEFQRIEPDQGLARARAFRTSMGGRRSVREFTSEPIGRELLEELVRTAGTAPSGAHKQPWRFVVVTDPELKRRIREAAEAEEREFYERRITPEWAADLEFLGLDWRKEFLEVAPALIAVFRVDFDRDPVGGLRKNYYVLESVGIAVGMLLCAIHQAGLVALTHTPSPMKFLNGILGRPANERPFVLMPVGYPSPGAQVHDKPRKQLEDILRWNV